MRKSFVKKSIALFLAVCIVPFSALAVVFLNTVQRLDKERMDESLGMIISEKVETLTRDIDNVTDNARNLALWASYTYDVPVDIVDFEKTYRRNSKGILESPELDSSSYLQANIPLTDELKHEVLRTEIIVPSMREILGENDGVSCVYIVTSTGFMRVYPYLDNVVFPEDHDQRNDIFYTNAAAENNPNGEARWTKPYFDYAGHGWITTCSYPYYVGGEFKGVVCIDVQLDAMTRSLVDFRLGDTGFAFIIEDTGDIIYHPDMKNLVLEKGSTYETTYGSGTSDSNVRAGILKAMQATSSGIENFTSEGKDKLIVFRSVDTVEWIIGLEIDKNDYIIGKGYLTAGIWGVIIMLLILILVFGIILTRRVTKPVVELTAGVRRLGDGKFELIPVKSDDELGELSAAFNRMSLDLHVLFHAEKMASLGQMMAGVVHELKNPLSVIKGATYLLKDDAADERQMIIREIDSNVERAEQIIYNMLDFSKVSHREAEIFPLKALLEQILLLVRQDYVRNKIDVRIDVNTVQSVYGNGDALKHIFLNTISNAIEAMPDGGQLRITADGDSGTTAIRISNTGAHISDEDMKNIFEPFFTTKANGTGLGLWIVSRELSKNEGNIRIENTDEGVEAVIELPTSQDEAESERRTDAKNPADR